MRHIERNREVLIVPHHQHGTQQRHPHSHNPHLDGERYFQLDANPKQKFTTQHQRQQQVSKIHDTRFASTTSCVTTLDISEITTLQCKIKSYTRKIKKEHKQQKQLLAALQRIEQQNIKIRQLEDTAAHKDDVINSILTKMKQMQNEHERYYYHHHHQQQQQQQQQQRQRQVKEVSLPVTLPNSNERNSSSSIQSVSISGTNTNIMKQKQQQYQKEKEDFAIKRTGLIKKRDTMQSKVEQLISKLLPSPPPMP